MCEVGVCWRRRGCAFTRPWVPGRRRCHNGGRPEYQTWTALFPPAVLDQAGDRVLGSVSFSPVRLRTEPITTSRARNPSLLPPSIHPLCRYQVERRQRKKIQDGAVPVHVNSKSPDRDPPGGRRSSVGSLLARLASKPLPLQPPRSTRDRSLMHRWHNFHSGWVLLGLSTSTLTRRQYHGGSHQASYSQLPACSSFFFQQST